MDEELKKWLAKAEEVKKSGFDLSRDEDLSIAIMNLVSLEEHFYFTAMKTENEKYLDMLNSVRALRIEILKRMVKDPKGEEWCISKHLLATSMRLMEVGTKELSKGNKAESQNFFKYAFELYSLFFAINLGIAGASEKSETKKESEKSETKKENESLKTEEKSGIFGRFSKIVKDAVDCCKEW